MGDENTGMKVLAPYLVFFDITLVGVLWCNTFNWNCIGFIHVFWKNEILKILIYQFMNMI